MVQSCLLLRGRQENQSEGTPPTFWGGGGDGFINPALALLTMPIILTTAHMKHQSKKHQAVLQTLLSHSMCQAFRFMPWAATRCAEHLLFKMLGGLERPEIRRC